jgi:hypothetical protein
MLNIKTDREQYPTHNKTEETKLTINKHIQKGQISTKVKQPAQLKNSSFLYIINKFLKHLMMVK